MEEVATRKTEAPTNTREDVEESEANTKISSDEANIPAEDKDTNVESKINVDPNPNDNFTYNFKPARGVKLNYMNPVTIGVSSIIPPKNNLS